MPKQSMMPFELSNKTLNGVNMKSSIDCKMSFNMDFKLFTENCKVFHHNETSDFLQFAVLILK